MTDTKQLVRDLWYQELWNNWNVGVAEQLFSADYQLHLSGVPTPLSRDATSQVVAMFRDAFPDLHHTVDEIIAEQDTVAARWTVKGTHRGDFQGIPATARSIRLSGITVHHLAEGKIVETWLSVDNLDLLQQLGAAAKANT
jgi:steroid delta-isomerase-like uncharacterized protein